MKSFFAIKALIVANSPLTVLAAATGVVGVGVGVGEGVGVGVFVAVGAGAVVAAGAGLDPPVSAAYEEGMLITSNSVKANFFMSKF